MVDSISTLHSLRNELQNLSPTRDALEAYTIRSRMKVRLIAPSELESFDKWAKISFTAGPSVMNSRTGEWFGGDVPPDSILVDGVIKRLDAFYDGLIDIEATKQFEAIASQPVDRERKVDSKKVFIVHGHDIGIRDAVDAFLRKLRLEPVIFDDQPARDQTLIQKLEANIDPVAFAIVLLTADDLGNAKAAATSIENLRPRARQNAILELGYVYAKLKRENVCVMCDRGLELPSDINGVEYVSTNEKAWQLDLAKELHAAGLPIDLKDLLA